MLPIRRDRAQEEGESALNLGVFDLYPEPWAGIRPATAWLAAASVV
jgi:hypothetical protein